jgi:hypothetical protein
MESGLSIVSAEEVINMKLPIFFTLGLLYLTFGIFANEISLITSPQGWTLFGSIFGAWVYFVISQTAE